jgi:hypothetical protein
MRNDMRNYILPALVIAVSVAFVGVTNWYAQGKVHEAQAQTNTLLTSIYAQQLRSYGSQFSSQTR